MRAEAFIDTAAQQKATVACASQYTIDAHQIRFKARDFFANRQNNNFSIMVTGTNMVQTNQLPAPSSVAMEATVANTTAKRISDNRRSNKPIMEKRRRARINNSLNELKTLILDAMKKDPARHSKLEKADILEMTVKHLQNLQRQQAAISAAADPSVISKFRAGFSECATEVGRFPGLDPIVKRRLLQHLANCLNQSPKDAPTAAAQQQQQQVQVHIVPNNTNQMDLTQNNGIILSNGNGTGVQLLPTRLPNGDIALVLPTATPSSSSSATSTASSSSLSSPQVVNNNSSGTTSPSLPLLVPIPQRTLSTSTISDTSSTHSNYSPSHSPEPTESTIYQPKPLSLVVRKVEPADVVVDEKPWRPW